MVIGASRGARNLMITTPGISTLVADVIIAETGVDMNRSRPPGTWRAGPERVRVATSHPGRVKSTTTRPGNPYLKAGIAAMSAARSHDTYLTAKYRRIAARRGPIKAIVALEHAMLIALWHMLRDGEFYAEPGGDFYTRRDPDKAKNRAIDQLNKLGYDVTVTAQQATG